MGMIHNTLLSINVIYIYIIQSSHGCLSGQGPNTQSLMSQKNANIIDKQLGGQRQGQDIVESITATFPGEIITYEQA